VFPPFAGSGVLRAVANATSSTDALADASAVDDALRRWSEAQLQVAAQVLPNAEGIERSYVFDMPDLTTVPTTATNDWISAAFPGLAVTLPACDCAHDGVLETPAVLALWLEREDAVVQGRDAIAQFFAQSFQARSGEGVFEDWFRSGQYFSDGRLLIWEYPRETPKGDQTDVVESMDLENGLITHHRVYWGWGGSASSRTPSTRPRQ
jgi:steroid Delta-isomerase